MEILNFETFDQIPALYFSEADMIIISDLHLGLEKTMTFKGNYVPQNQLEKMKDELREMKKETGAEKILLNGDLKNQYKTSYSENEEVKELANFLNFNFEQITVVEGNHDTFIESTLEEKGIEMKKYHLENGALFIHGDTEINNIDELDDERMQEVDTVIIGHEHPAIALEDDIGIREKIPALLYQKSDTNLIVIPAFSRIANGTSVNEVPDRELLSPVLRERIDREKMKAIGISREAGILEFPELYLL